MFATIFALVLSSISIGATAVLNYIVFGIWTGMMNTQDLQDNVVAFALLALFCGFIIVLSLCIWLFLWAGIRGELKKIARKSTKV